MTSLPERRGTRWEPADDDAARQCVLLDELKSRMIHVEQKLDQLLRERERDPASAGASAAAGGGHADQAFGGRTYAQYGEDLMLLNLFNVLGVKRPSYFDVGAHHPYNISNTALLYKTGCRGINVEANPNLVDAFLRERPEDITLNVGVGPRAGSMPFYFIDDWSGRNTFDRATAEAFVREHPSFQVQKIVDITVLTLRDIVDRYADGRFPNLLSLDTEGWDVQILQACAFGPEPPMVICTEAVTGADEDAGPALIAALRQRGYTVYVRTLGNLIAVRDDLLAKLR